MRREKDKNGTGISYSYLALMSIFALLFSLFSASLVSSVALVGADITIVTPASSAVINPDHALGGTVINITIPGSHAQEGYNQSQLWIKSTATANSTYVNFTLGNFSSIDAGTTLIQYNLTGNVFNTTNAFEDGSYTIKVEMVNGSAGGGAGMASINSSEVTVTIDHTVPQTPTLTPATNTNSPQISSVSSQTFTATLTGANTTSCTYVIARGGSSSGSDYITGTATHSGNTCTFTKAFTSTTNNGEWKWYVNATDGLNTSRSVINTFSVQLIPVGGAVLSVGQEGGIFGGGAGMFWAVLIVVIIAGIWLIIKFV